MKRSELNAALRLVASWVWNDGEDRLNTMQTQANLSMPVLCETMAVEIFTSRLDCGFRGVDTQKPIDLIREALLAYHRDGFLEFDDE